MLNRRAVRLLALLVVVCALFIAGALLVSALDDRGVVNDPTVNERANACYEDGTLAGTCHITDVNGDGSVSEADVEYMWVFGWYLIRYQYGLIPLEVLQERFGYVDVTITTSSGSQLQPTFPPAPTYTPGPSPTPTVTLDPSIPTLTPTNTPTDTPTSAPLTATTTPTDTPTVEPATATTTPTDTPTPTETTTPTDTPTPA